MTFNEFLKEINVLPNTINTQFIATGMTKLEHLPGKSEELPEDQAALLRKYCLFRMLGYSRDETKTLIEDFKTSLTGHINTILNDNNNNSQAAIVLSNIKRNEESFEALDPTPYIEQIKELRAKGGLFYDINSGILDGYAEFWSRSPEPASSESNEKWSTVSSGQIYNAEDVWKRNHSQNQGSSETEDKSDSEKSDNGFIRRNSSNYYGDYSSGVFGSRYGRPIPVSNYAGDGTTSGGDVICPHPIRRYLARMLDQMIVALPIEAFFYLYIHVDINSTYILNAAILILGFFVSCLVEPFILAIFGTTPGKAIMGIKLTPKGEDRKLTLKEAAVRTIKLIRYGFGFMIPLYNLICEYRSLNKCRFGAVLEWDKDCDISLKTPSLVRIIAILISIILVVNCETFLSYQAMIPSHRGNITVEQFYDNCLEFMDYAHVVGDPHDLGYTFTTDSNGYITSVIFDYETNAATVVPPSLATQLAFVAYAAATDGSNGLTLASSDAVSAVMAPNYTFATVYQNVKITNVIQCQGYSVSQSMQTPVYVSNNQDDSKYHQTFTMTKQESMSLATCCAAFASR